MMRFIVFALIAVAAWYGWSHRDSLFSKHPSHDAVIVNRSGREMDRVRLNVGGNAFVKEALADGATVTFPFRVSDDASFDLVWQWNGSDMEQHWTGGRVPKGPMVQRHTIMVDGDGGVTYQPENKLAPQ